MITYEAVVCKGAIVSPFPENGFYIFPVLGSADDTCINLKEPSAEQIQEAIEQTDSQYVIVEYLTLSGLIVISPVTYSETRPTAKDTMFYAVPSNTIGWT